MNKYIKKSDALFDCNMNPARRNFLKQTTGIGLLAMGSFVASGDVFSSSELSTHKLKANSLRFGAQRLDPVTRHYHLGNGYRMYNPQIMRFHACDTMSPFGEGGLNSYAYCAGDPVNRSDPSGHSVLIDRLIAGIIGAVIGAIIASVVEGIRCAITGDSFNWKVVVIGAAVGFVTGALGPGAGLSLGMKLLVGFGMSVAVGLTTFAVEAAMGADLETAAIEGVITAAVTFVTFGIMTGAGQALKTPIGQALTGRVKAASVRSANQIHSAMSRLSRRLSRNYPAIPNSKPQMFERELLQFRQTARMNAHVFRVGGCEDLMQELSQPGVHKFVVSAHGDFNIGTISGAHTKSLSHAVIAENFYYDVVGAGYIAKVGGRVIVTNHSGHFRPSYESLEPVVEVLRKLGVDATKCKASRGNPGFLMLKALHKI